MSLQDRINSLQEATANGSPFEHFLLREPIRDVQPNGTATTHTSTTYVVYFESRYQAIHKPFAGQDPAVCSIYNQDPFEAPTHEVVAWRLAHAMGEPWSQLLPAAVLRTVPAGNGPGALINWRPGGPNDAAFIDVRDQIFAGAFWDCLIGQQDRHVTNYRYDATSKRLAIIDNAFAFARPGDFYHASLFLAYRRHEHCSALRAGERVALDHLLASELHGLHTFLPEDRADAIAARAERMLNRNDLLLPGAYE